MGSLAIQPNSPRAYALALGLLGAALAAQWSVRPLVGAQVPFLFFLPAIGIAAMYGGWGPGLLTLAGGLLNALLWMREGSGLTLADPGGRVALAGYLLAAGLLAAMGGRICMLRARAAAAETNLGSQLGDLQALHELNARIALLPELHDQLQAVLETLCTLQGADKGLLLLWERGESNLHVAASVGFAPGTLKDELLSVPIGAGACGRAFSERAPVVIADTEADPRFEPYRQLARDAGFRAVHSRPLLHRSGEAFGVISLHYAQPRALSPGEQRLGDLCAGVAAVLAERDEALRRAVASSRRLEVALDTSAVPFCLVSALKGEGGKVTGFRWIYLNAAAAAMLRRDPAQVTGLPVLSTLRAGVAMDPGMRARFVEALEQHRTVRFETWAEGPEGRRWLDVIASPYDDGLAVWFSDVTARKEQEETLREADRRKDEFLAMLAHELRNPLAPVRQAALIARSPHATEEKKQWAYGVIERQVGHMAMLLDDLLDVSRITRGKLELRKAPTSLAEAVDAALEAVRPLIEARHQHLETRLPAAPLCLDADRLRLAQVLSNLLTNASKYTPEGGRIELAAREDAGWAVVEVHDDGAGIAPEAIDRIFEMFTQVRGPEAGRTGGLGIGLALSRGLIELHGGRLEASSPGLGQGSTFTVRLPIGAAHEPPASPAEPAGTPARVLRVLVADDNRDAAQSLAHLLRLEGHDVALAFDGQEALEAFDRFHPHVALLDIGMPHLTGNQVARAIRARPGGDRTLLVAITGWGQQRDREAAREAGFDVHFTKPVDPQKVLRLVGSAPAEAGSAPGAVLPLA